MREVLDWLIVVGVVPGAAVWGVIESRRRRRGSAVLPDGRPVPIRYPSAGRRGWPPGWYGLMLGVVLTPAGLVAALLGIARREPAFALPAIGFGLAGLLGLVSGVAGLTRRATSEGLVVQRRRIPSDEGERDDACFIAVAAGTETAVRGVQVTLPQYTSVTEGDRVRLTTNPAGDYVYSVTVITPAAGERMP